MIEANSLSPEVLRIVITKLPPGRARHKYERLLCEKIGVLLGGVQCEMEPALYYVDEILVLKSRTHGELREIHKYKLAYPGCRLIQEGAEG